MTMAGWLSTPDIMALICEGDSVVALGLLPVHNCHRDCTTPFECKTCASPRNWTHCVFGTHTYTPVQSTLATDIMHIATVIL